MPSLVIERASNRQWSLKPQDLVVALKLLVSPAAFANYRSLGASIFLSQFEAHAAIQRLQACRLLVGERALQHRALHQFLIYGARYCFPVLRGEMTIGTPTAYAVAPLRDLIHFADDAPPVWPHAEGEVRGVRLTPLYAKQPLAALADPKLHQALALFDALRIGGVRERKLATEHLDALFPVHAHSVDELSGSKSGNGW